MNRSGALIKKKKKKDPTEFPCLLESCEEARRNL